MGLARGCSSPAAIHAASAGTAGILAGMKKLIAPTLIALAIAACASSGSSDRGFDAASPTLAAKRAAKRAAADAQSRARMDAMTPAGVRLGESRLDACFHYQQNWKIRDPNRVECHLHLSRAVAVPDVGAAINESARLAAVSGCANDAAFADSLRYYREANGAGSNARYRRPTNLPEVSHACSDEVRLRVQLLNPDARDDAAGALRNIDAMVGARPVAQLEKIAYADAAINAALATPHPLVVVVAIDRRYHAEPW